MNKDLLIKEEVERFKKDFPKLCILDPDSDTFYRGIITVDTQVQLFLESSLSKMYEEGYKDGYGDISDTEVAQGLKKILEE